MRDFDRLIDAGADAFHGDDLPRSFAVGAARSMRPYPEGLGTRQTWPTVEPDTRCVNCLRG